jgi:hypothetical protein
LSFLPDEPPATLTIAPDLALAEAEDRRQSLIAAVMSGTGPAVIEFDEGVVGTVALQLGLATAAALTRQGRQADFGPNAQAVFRSIGLGAAR